MVEKKQNRSLYVIEVYEQSQFLGFYAGKDDENNLLYGELNNASTIKSDKAAEHILNHLIKYDGDRYSFKKRMTFEVRKTTYYDEYEEPEWQGQKGFHFIIRVKQKSDMISEPAFVCEFDKATGAFKTSYRISKAQLYTNKRAKNICERLSSIHSDIYLFYPERIYIKEERAIELI